MHYHWRHSEHSVYNEHEGSFNRLMFIYLNRSRYIYALLLRQKCNNIYTCSLVILQHPTDRTVFLDNSAFFSCLTRGGSNAHWRLNGTDYEDLPSELRNDLVTSNGSTSLSEFIDLIILSRAEYNETRVQCVIENDDGDSVVSDTAILYIQGHVKYIK